MKNILFREFRFLVISILLVMFAYMLSGTFFKVWIDDYYLLLLMVLLFYLIIGFYRVLNHLARKYRDDASGNM